MINQPKATRIDEKHFILDEDYSYTWPIQGINTDNPSDKYDVETTIIVKKGFRWDGASVPKIFWSWGFKTDGKHRGAALIHDFIYIHEGKLPEGSMTSSYLGHENQIQYGSFSRKDCDRLFGKMMKEAGVKSLRKKLMKWAVSSFGWVYWKDGPDLMRKLFWSILAFLSLMTILVKVLFF